MIELNRKEIQMDPLMVRFKEDIKKSHRVADHTLAVLKANKGVKDFCEVARHFAIVRSKTTLHIHYDVSSWYKHPDQVLVRIESIGFYADFTEYETARRKEIHGIN